MSEHRKAKAKMMSRFSSSLLAFLLLTSLASACISTPPDSEPTSSPQAVFSLVTNQGLTCAAQGSILAMNEAEHEELAQLFQLAEMTVEQRWAVVDSMEKGCSASEPAFSGEDEVVSQVQAITGTYTVVQIPESTVSGNYATSVFRDSSSSSWMCNSGSPESPADYVAQFHLQGAYYNRNSLKLWGQNWWGSCYLGSLTASRVYSDDDVRSCIGYWTVILCGGTPPLRTDIVLGL